MKRMNIKAYGKLIVSIALCQGAGVIGALFNTPENMLWYDSLVQSSVTPPGWAFGVVWPLLYLLMGIAFFIVWHNHTSIFDDIEKVHMHTQAIVLFLVQLAINVFWSFAFFALHLPSASLLAIIALWCLIAVTTMRFARMKKSAGLLMVPYLAWVSFAFYLNFMIWALN